MTTIIDYFRNFHIMTKKDPEFFKLKHQVTTKARADRILKIILILRKLN